jgi:hypothetical protein
MPVFAGRLDQFLDIQGSNSVDNAKTLAEENTSTGSQTSTGTGDSFAFATPTVTLTDAGASFTSADIGRFITIAGATSGGNDGTFLIESVPTGTTLTYSNTSAVAEAYTGTWTINEPYTLEDDLNFTRTDRKLIKGTAQHYTDIPTYVRPSAIGTNVDKNLTNLLSVDGYATVRDVRQVDIKLRPDISETGTGTLAIADETFTVSDMHFVAGDLDSFITISNSTDADGIYRIKAVTDGQTLELDGLASATAESCDWKLESDLKGILSSRSYADAVDRRGVPIADSGAEDETVYDATFADVIDPLQRLGVVEEDGDAIFARSFGDEKDPNRTATNEGTRFFVQLVTGPNTGSAVDSSLEIISGRSGSAASVTNASTTVTGLTGMSDVDVGKYLTIYNTAVDGNQRHARITTYNSASSVDVDGSNFTTDGNDGSIKWQVSRQPANWDFYNGDRYRDDEISETAGRTTLIGGIVSDAELTQDIAEIREFIGAGDGETTPALTNTGNYFPWSDLPNSADTSLEECINILNQEIGNRDYSATALANVSGLADGQTITASIEALALAIGAASITRYIERLAADITAHTVHDLPAGAAYTVDATDNGRNMYVFWRKLLRDPGVVANDDDYDETSGSGGGGGVGQITPYTKIKNGDHISYMILQ